MHLECHKAEDSILDLGQTMGRVSLYEETFTLFWIMKNLMGRAASDKISEAPEAMDEAQWHASISLYIQHLGSKVDFLVSCLGF